jgi:hypothetical protein
MTLWNEPASQPEGTTNMPRAGQSTGRRRRLKSRDAHGRFIKGHSGNPRGRPRKEPEMPKLLDEVLAEKLLHKQPVSDADGKVRMVSAYDRIIDSLIESLTTAKPREKMQILQWLETREVFNHMREMTEDPWDSLSHHQHRSWQEERRRARILEAMAEAYWPK